MNRHFLSLITSAALLIAAQQAFAGGPKVTGGGNTIKSSAAEILFSMTASGIETGNGRINGSIQYSREANNGSAELFVHTSVVCMWISPDGLSAVVAGPAEVQSNPSGIAEEAWFFAAIQEGGTGYGDRVRTGFVDVQGGLDKCLNGETLFPGLVEEGNFTIRQ